jgi:hypothetical protein
LVQGEKIVIHTRKKRKRKKDLKQVFPKQLFIFKWHRVQSDILGKESGESKQTHVQRNANDVNEIKMASRIQRRQSKQDNKYRPRPRRSFEMQGNKEAPSNNPRTLRALLV